MIYRFNFKRSVIVVKSKWIIFRKKRWYKKQADNHVQTELIIEPTMNYLLIKNFINRDTFHIGC